MTTDCMIRKMLSYVINEDKISASSLMRKNGPITSLLDPEPPMDLNFQVGNTDRVLRNVFVNDPNDYIPEGNRLYAVRETSQQILYGHVIYDYRKGGTCLISVDWTESASCPDGVMQYLMVVEPQGLTEDTCQRGVPITLERVR